MIDLPTSLFVAAFANNALLSHAFGAEYLNSQHGMRRVVGLTATLACSAVPATLLAWLLASPLLGIDHSMGLFVLIVACAALMLVMQRLLQTVIPRIATPLTESQSLLLLDSVVLAMAVANLHAEADLLRGFAAALAGVGGFGLVLILLAAMRDRLRGADIPVVFRGTPIELVTLALLSVAFLGFASIGQRG